MLPFILVFASLTSFCILPGLLLVQLQAHPNPATSSPLSKPRTSETLATRTNSSAAAHDFEQANIFFKQGALSQALSAVQRGLAIHPNDVEGLNLLGMIYHRQKQYAKSADAFRKAVKINPQSLTTLNNLATSYSAQQKDDFALHTLREILTLDPDNSTANFNFGLLLLGKHKPKEAIFYLECVEPKDPPVLLSLTQAYFMAGMEPEGTQTAQDLSNLAGKDVKLHFSLAVALASVKQYAPAIREFETANALQPRTFEILHDLGQAYLRNNEPGKAEPPLEQALQLQPGSADTLYLLAQSASDQRRDIEALELLTKARKAAPKNTNILLLLARLSMKQSFFEDAIPLLNEAIKIEPRRPDLHAALGESYFTVGKVEKALQEFRLLLELDPSAGSYAFMGLTYRHLGKFDEAKHYLNQGLKTDPNNLLCLFNLGYIAKRQGDVAQAEHYLARALQIAPDYEDAIFELGSLKMEEKKYQDSISLLRHCTEVSEKPAQAYYKLAIAERNLHQTEASQRDMNIFITLSKNPQPGPYPLQHFFNYMNRRAGMSNEQKNESDLRALETEVKKNPERPGSLYLLAEAYLKLGRNREALSTIAQLDKLSGSDFRSLLGEGVMLAQFHLYPEAIQHFEAAVTTDPASDEARYNLANAQYQIHEYEKAFESLQKVSAEGQKDDAYLGLLGDLYIRLGRTQEGIEALRLAIRKSPENDQNYLSLALAQMMRTEDTNAAFATLQQGLTRIPDSGALYWGLGIASVLRSDAGGAEKYLKKAVDLAPARASALISLGFFYFEVGRIQEARVILQRYSETFPVGEINVEQIKQALENAETVNASVLQLSPEARHAFYNFAVGLRQQEQ